MKYFELKKDEKQLLDDFEQGKLKKVPNAQQEKARYEGYAKHTLNREKNINIRISAKDLQKIKAIAVEKGLPYQTLVSSLLHQYSTGRIRESARAISE